MARRGENIYKRKDGRWEGRYIKGRKPNGKAIYGSVYARKYSDVKIKLIPLKSQYAVSQSSIKNFCGSLQDWLAYWLEDIIKQNIKTSTYASYRGTIERHILPTLGQKYLHKLTDNDIQHFIHDLRTSGLKPSTIHGIFRILNAALEQAVYCHAIFISPCRHIVLPKMQKTVISALSQTEQKALETAAMQDKNGTAAMLSLYTGMRIGEICALKWSDINFDEEMIHVNRTVLRIPCYAADSAKTEVIFNTPKSETSRRCIPMSINLVAYLKQCKTNAKGDFVVSCKKGLAEPRVVSYRFEKLLKTAGIEHTHFHALRHTFATRCMEMGIDITTISRLLGHASVKMTLDIYTDSLMEHRKAAIYKLDSFFVETNSLAV